MELHMKNKIKSLVLAGMVLVTPAVSQEDLGVVHYMCIPTQKVGKDPVVWVKLNIYFNMDSGNAVNIAIAHKTLSGKKFFRSQQYKTEKFEQDCKKKEEGFGSYCENISWLDL